MDAVISVNVKGKIHKIDSFVVSDLTQLKPLLSEEGWKVFSALSNAPDYPASVAKKLNVSEQKIHYYFKQLLNAGLIELVKTEEKQGGVAKFFQTKHSSFSFITKKSFDKSEKNALAIESINSEKDSANEETKKILDFFNPIVSSGGELNAKIIVGSPDAHGEFKARARDGHLAGELSAFLGSICRKINLPLVFLDTMIQPLEKENSNLIIIGGILTNRIAKEANEFAQIKFSPFGGSWKIVSNVSSKEYFEDSTGIIQKFQHPFFKNKSILWIAGKRTAGTVAGILALIKKTDEIIKPNQFDKNSFSHVVEGIDSSGTGIIDEVEIKE